MRHHITAFAASAASAFAAADSAYCGRIGRRCLPIVLFAVALAAAGTAAAQRSSSTSEVVVARGQPLQIAVVLDKSDFIGVAFAPGIENAIQMAVEQHPAIRGFPVQLNQGFDAPCFTNDAVAANADTATAVVSNPQNVAVIGHMCSYAFAGVTEPISGVCSLPEETTALAIYEAAGIVTINGSTTSPCVPLVGPDVFNGTAVPDPNFDGWYAQVQTLPSDLLWQSDYALEFGTPPTEFADLYFDATNLLLRRLQTISQISNQQLVIDRAMLAHAVRNTTDVQGVTCTISLDPTTGYRIDDTSALARCAA